MRGPPGWEPGGSQDSHSYVGPTYSRAHVVPACHPQRAVLATFVQQEAESAKGEFTESIGVLFRVWVSLWCDPGDRLQGSVATFDI